MPTNPYPYRLKRRLQRFISPQPALPARLRRPRVLVVGCGAIGQRLLRHWQQQSGRSGQHGLRIMVLTSSPDKRAQFQALGATPIVGNLDVPASLQRLRGWAHYLLHLAPPPGRGVEDSRTRHLLRTVQQRPGRLRALVYVSTTAVYGDSGGQWLDETQAPAPSQPRGQRRWQAEQQLIRYGKSPRAARTVRLRVPGIFAPERLASGLAQRLAQGQPVLHREEDVWSNRIHADDLARACLLALWRGQAQRCLHISDGQPSLMGDYFDRVADHLGLPRPPRLSREAIAAHVSPAMLSYLQDSRRLRSERMLRELGLVVQPVLPPAD